MHVNPNQKTILTYIADGDWHCFASKDFFMKDDRKRISELNEMGFEVIGEKCDGRCGLKHNARLKMRKLVKVPPWFDWRDIGIEHPRPLDAPRQTNGPERISFERKPEHPRPREWVFESKTQPGKKYHVVDFTTFLACDCPGYVNRKACSHIDQVNELLKINRPQTVQSAQGTLI